MSDMGEMWREHNEHLKKVRDANLKRDSAVICRWADEGRIRLEMVQYYHFRVFRKDTTLYIDIFPMKKRWFSSFRKRWKFYSNVEELLAKIATASDSPP